MNEKKKLTINMIASLFVFALTMGMNFFLSPYIIKNIGTEAYGFVSLANNFVNYATIITIALNSMASRFITIAIHKNDKELANKYFTSVLIANIIIIAALVLPATGVVIWLDKILNIPVELIKDVKALFMLIFLNFFITIIDATYSVATFATNTLYIRSLNTMKSNLIKIGLLIGLFAMFIPKVFYVGIATLISSIFLLITDIYYTNKLLPDIKVRKKYFSVKSIITLIVSGIWNTITKLGQLLTDGLDLIICNLLIDSISMGRLAIAKTISGVVSTLLSTVSNIFQPEFTIFYAKRKIRKLVENAKMSMKITGFFANIPLAFLFGFGVAFYKLWTPTENAEMIAQLTLLTVSGIFVSGALTPLYAIYTVTNKIKVDAICRVVLGIINIAVVYVVIKTTNLGIYAVAGTSVLIGTIFNFIFVPTYTAYCLRIKKTTFYPVLLRYMATTIGLVLVICIISKFFVITNWIELFIAAVVTSIIGLSVNYIILLNKKERDYLISVLKNKLLRKKETNKI